MRTLFLTAIIACVAGGPGPASASSGARDPAQALIDADLAFAADNATGGAKAWAAWFAPDGVQLPSSGRVVGQDAIRKHMTPLDKSGNRLQWKPDIAVMGSWGDLGYTVGTWQLVNPADEVVGTGNYVSIWTLTDAGWRVAVDIGNQD